MYDPSKDPSRGDHDWNDRSDDERREITSGKGGVGYASKSAKSGMKSVSKSGAGLNGRGPVASGRVGTNPGKGAAALGVASGPQTGSNALHGQGVPGAGFWSALARGGKARLPGKEAQTGAIDLLVNGVTAFGSPFRSMAVDVEDSHGDLAGSLYGIYSVYEDMRYNSTGKPPNVPGGGMFTQNWGGLTGPDLRPHMQTDDYAGKGHDFASSVFETLTEGWGW